MPGPRLTVIPAWKERPDVLVHGRPPDLRLARVHGEADRVALPLEQLQGAAHLSVRATKHPVIQDQGVEEEGTASATANGNLASTGRYRP
jgi:hypothetical protein